MSSPEAQLEQFIDKYSPAIADLGRSVLKALRERMPSAALIVYDNYNALAVGFGPNDRTSNVILSVAFYPRWVSLFFMQGIGLADPRRLLRGRGSRVRHIVLSSAEDLAHPDVSDLIDEALRSASIRLPEVGVGSLTIKSVSVRQRTRRLGLNVS